MKEHYGKVYDLRDMKVPKWLDFVCLVRKEAKLNDAMNNHELARHLILVLAREVRKNEYKMTAQTLVAILNEVDRFRNENWQYSLQTRGPCSVVRGAWNAIKNDSADAEMIAEAFTKTDWNYAYES